MRKINLKWKLLIALIFLLLLSSTFTSVYLMKEIKEYNNIINNVGRIRGLSQRIVKLEINYMPSDEFIDKLNDILMYLKKETRNIGSNINYKNKILNLDSNWKDLYNEIRLFRLSPSDNRTLLLKSENFYDIADDTVVFVETYSNNKMLGVSAGFAFITVTTILAWLFIIIFYIRYLNKLQNMNNELEKKAYIDTLTNLNNFEKFQIEAEKLLSKSHQYAMFYCDIENFKYINDMFGYKVGDMVLKYFSQIINEEVGVDETFARVSADNFIIMKKFSNRDDLTECFNRISNKLLSYDEIVSRNHRVTICTGIFCVEDISSPLTVNEMIDRANYAQNTVKSHNNKRYAFYNEKMRNQIIYEKKIENDMEEALKNDEFVFYLQPKISLKNDKIAAAEALVRWNYNNNFIPPDKFIPLFEKNLFITRLDKYTFEQVCIQMRIWLDEGKHVVPISVNVSKIQFYNPDFVKIYTSIKNKYNIPNNKIEIEFTESVMFENTDAMLKIISDLHNNGFDCAIDDFGSGYSSLNLLKNISVNVLKLDRMFFYRSENEEKERIVVQSIIQMAKNLHIVTVAEGIETWEQVDLLRKMGCDMIQGYIFSKPITPDDFAKKYL